MVRFRAPLSDSKDKRLVLFVGRNHTGLYIARKGYFKEAGVDVDKLPPEDSTSDLIINSKNYRNLFPDSMAKKTGQIFQENAAVAEAIVEHTILQVSFLRNLQGCGPRDPLGRESS